MYPELADEADQASVVARLRLLWEYPAARVGAVVLSVVAALVAGLVWWSRPVEVAVAPSIAVAGSAVPVESSAPPGGVGVSDNTKVTAGNPAIPATVMVDIVGPVRRPGLVTLPAGSRVADAISAAGGLARGKTSVNLARVLIDGEQIDVAAGGEAGVRSGAGALAPGASSSSTGSATGVGGAAKIDINLAAATELEQLPRVGPVMAQKIIEFRTQHGGFRSVDQLREVSGIGEVTFASLAPLVRV